MREFKFRAWDKDAGKYTHGMKELYVDISDVGIGAYCMEQMCPGRYIIEQYIGIKDKNGKEVYEGDIMETPDGDVRYIVEWNGSDLSYWGMALIGGVDFSMSELEKNDIVVGNIHENPELLEEKK